MKYIFTLVSQVRLSSVRVYLWAWSSDKYVYLLEVWSFVILIAGNTEIDKIKINKVIKQEEDVLMTEKTQQSKPKKRS